MQQLSEIRSSTKSLQILATYASNNESHLIDRRVAADSRYLATLKWFPGHELHPRRINNQHRSAANFFSVSGNIGGIKFFQLCPASAIL